MSNDLTGSANGKKRSPLALAKLIGGIAAILLVIIVILQNTEPVAIRVLFFPAPEMPLAALLFITLLVGTATGFVLAWMRPWRKKKR